ncbi:MAG: histidine kinase N-terminal 7TM domain-containing protein [Candidatus Margulisiibacteriota bacterium]|jgi:PAS domain-containing protein
MTPFVFFYGLSLIGFGGLSLMFGVFIHSRFHSGTSRNYFLLTITIFLTALAEAFIRLAATPETAAIWLALAVVFWFGIVFSFLYFTAFFAGKKINIWPLLYALAALVVVSFILPGYAVAGFEKRFYGYGLIPGPTFFLFMIYAQAVTALGLFYLARALRRAKEFYNRRQALIFIVAGILSSLLIVIFDQVLLILGYNFVPIGIICVSTIASVAAYGMLRYAPVANLTKEAIAEAASTTLSDPLIIADNERIITYANPAVTNLTGFRPDELVGKPVADFFSQEKGGIYNLKRKRGAYLVVSLAIFPISGGKGALYLARDLTSVVKLRKAVHKMTAEKNLSLNKEKAVVRAIFEFAETNRPDEVEALWRRLTEGSLGEILRPVYALVKEYAELMESVHRSRDELAGQVEELEKTIRLMSGREEALKELEKKYRELTK